MKKNKKYGSFKRLIIKIGKQYGLKLKILTAPRGIGLGCFIYHGDILICSSNIHFNNLNTKRSEIWVDEKLSRFISDITPYFETEIKEYYIKQLCLDEQTYN